MLYHFELMMAGWVLLTAMLAGGIWMYIKRKRETAADAEVSIADIRDDDAEEQNAT